MLLNINVFNAKILSEIFSERNNLLIIIINNNDYQKINQLRREKIENYKNYNDDERTEINLYQ